MEIFTSNFAKHAGNSKSVSIAQHSPKWFTGRKMTKLAPLWSLVKKTKYEGMTQSQFEVEFQKQLDKLDPLEIAKELGDGSIMLCYEKETDNCHRFQVAEWLKKAGIESKELKFEKKLAPRSKTVKERSGALNLKKKKVMSRPGGLTDRGHRIYNTYEILLE